MTLKKPLETSSPLLSALEPHSCHSCRALSVRPVRLGLPQAATSFWVFLVFLLWSLVFLSKADVRNLCRSVEPLGKLCSPRSIDSFAESLAAAAGRVSACAFAPSGFALHLQEVLLAFLAASHPKKSCWRVRSVRYWALSLFSPLHLDTRHRFQVSQNPLELC